MATVTVENDFKVVNGSVNVAADFTVQDGATYFVSHPNSVATSGSYTNKLYTYLGSATATSVTASSYPAINPFRNKPFPDNNAWSPPWTSGDIGTHRLCFNFGESVRLIGIEWKGMGNTGYVGLISSPKDTILRFGTSAFSGAYNSSTGNVANLTKQWQNLQDGASAGSTSGLAEYYDLKAANSNTAIVCSNMCIDMTSSWDGNHNMGIEHILFWVEVPTSANSITALVPLTVNKFKIVDRVGNFNELSNVKVNVGTDNIYLKVPQSYDFNRIGNKYIVQCGGFNIAEGNV